MVKDSEFKQLPLRRKELLNTCAERYRVYKNPKEYVIVEATTAKQAFEVSGLTEAYRILPESVDIDGVLEEGIWANKTAEAPEKAVPATEAEVPAPAIPKEEASS